MWRAIRKELDDIGISVAAFDANKSFIFEWFQNAISNGTFDEQTTNDNMDSDETGDLSRPSSSNLDGIIDSNSDYVQPDDRPGKPITTTSAPIAASSSPKVIDLRPSRTFPSTSPLPPKDEPTSRPSTKVLRKKTPRVVALAAWVFRYNASFLQACEVGDLKNAEILLAKGANIDANTNGCTALKMAVMRKKDDVVKWLLEHGAVPQDSLLHESVAIKRVATAQLLLRHGARIDLKLLGVTPLIRASKKGLRDMVEMLLKEGASVNSTGAIRVTALYAAVQGGHFEIVQELVAHGAKLDVRQNENNDVALLCALRKGFDSIAYFLIENGADIHLKEKGFWSQQSTALHLAAKGGCLRSMELLLDKGMDVNAKDHLKFTPLDYAVTLEAPTAAKLLLDNGAINDHATRLSHLYLDMVRGYTRFNKLLRNYPHGTPSPQALYA
jgi:ankyrin repeat protein